MNGREGGRGKGQTFVQGLNPEEHYSCATEINYSILYIYSIYIYVYIIYMATD